MGQKEYVKPSLRLIPTSLEYTICGSPQPGGHEGIGYDDWMDNN